MSLRDEVEDVLRSWNLHETARNAPAVIDYDCYPVAVEVEPARSRLDVYERLSNLQVAAGDSGNQALAERIGAHLAYLRELMGVRINLPDYIRQTQGCDAAGWPEEYVLACREKALAHLDAMGIGWGENTSKELAQAEGPLDMDAAADVIRASAAEFEPAVRTTVGSDADFALSIEKVEVNAYWGYWVDGVGNKVRLRLNLRQASFTKVTARQFALHEVLGHGLQGASYSQRCAQEDVPWVRLLSVHAQQQVLLEGLAQALPLFITPDDQQLTARVRLAHYTELVLSELHLALGKGATVEDCVRIARSRMPYWSPGRIADALADRGTDPLLRSYMWAYPAGIDWFVHLADDGDAATIATVLRMAYRDPLTPRDLVELWPTRPDIGGSQPDLGGRKGDLALGRPPTAEPPYDNTAAQAATRSRNR